MRKPPKNTYFDKRAADRVVNFIERYVLHSIGDKAGEPFILEKWQKEDIIYPIFGTKRKSDGLRQYTLAYIEIPRKNGKSALASALAIYLTCADNEKGAHVYVAAASKKQAGAVFDPAKSIVRDNPLLSSKMDVFKESIVHNKTNSFCKVLPADADTLHGKNAHGVVFDELHVQPNRDLYDVMLTSSGSRSQPLMIVITTAGLTNTFGEEVHLRAKKVIEGSLRDDSMFAIIYAAHEDDDIFKVATMKKANPGYGSILKPRFIKQMAATAKTSPSFVNTYKRLHLNLWTGAESQWITDSVWSKNDKGKLSIHDFEGRRCFAGLDLASNRDLCSLCLIFPSDDDETCDVIWHHWCPEDTISKRTKLENIEYEAWVRQGWVTATPGNIVDYAYIEKTILDISNKVRLIDLGFDRHGSYDLIPKLVDHGINATPIYQSISSLSASNKILENLICDEKVNHGGNPVMRWQNSNVTLTTNSEGYIKADKGKSKDKIDGMVAFTMAIKVWKILNEKPATSIYETRGIIDM